MKALDDGNFACGIFVDLQKAFDTVDHSILLGKLCHYGIRELANKWFKSYLANHKQFVSINGFESSTSSINHRCLKEVIEQLLYTMIFIIMNLEFK